MYFEDDEKTVYDIEMQRSDTKELPLRSRYYQGMIDLEYLKTGKHYSEFPDSYIIFLCTFDLFKLGYHKYSFAPKCREVEELELGDRTDRIFICAGGDKNDVSDDMKALINYITGEAANSTLTSRIDMKVREAIEKQLWRVEYMTYKEHMDEEYNRGKEEGIKAFIEDKLEDGVTKEAIIEKLMKRFDLTKEKATEYLHKYSE